jgi:hypothetical protein
MLAVSVLDALLANHSRLMLPFSKIKSPAAIPRLPPALDPSRSE